jgi:propanediol dehydratase small subunit
MRNSVQAELPAWSVSPQGRSILAGNFEEVFELTAVSGDLNALLVKLNSELFG